MGIPTPADDLENMAGREGQKRKRSPTPQDSPLFSKAQQNAPATPAGRLPLTELINVRDKVPATKDESPAEERVSWGYDKNHILSPGPSAMRRKAGKKRARSSSPISSPAHASAHFAKGQSFDAQRPELSNSLVDPGSELWGRFNSQARTTPFGLRNAALDQLMQTSSPKHNRNSTSPRSELKLRRATSCGTQWPSNKRRKLFATEESVGEEVSAESSLSKPSKGSLVNALIEQVTLPKAYAIKTPHRQSSSPSPSNKKVEGDGSLADEPGGYIDIDGYRSPDDRKSTSNDDQITPDATLDVDAASDYGEFDDDDLDDEVLMVIDGKTVLSHTSPSISKSHEAPMGVDMEIAAANESPPRSKSSSSRTLPVEDEFGDSDDDTFAADLADIAAEYDTVEEQTKLNSNAVQATRPPQSVAVNLVESDDEFGEDFDAADFELAEAAASQSRGQSFQPGTVPPPYQKVRAIQRYLVTHIQDNQYQTPRGTKKLERVLLLQGENTNRTRTVYLRDGWLDTSVSKGAYVHVIGEFNDNQCIIDDEANMIILHPDHLVSSTVVADSFGCLRRAVLQDRVKAANDKSPPLVYGTILHEIFQAAMMANKWNTKFLMEAIDSISKKHLEDLYTIRVEVPQALEYLKSKMLELQAWAEIFVTSKPKPNAVVQAGNGTTSTMCVSKLLDVEEHVWSPMYGLKGNIDATVQVTMKDGKEERTLTVPFEVKTGKTANSSHRAQTALYNLLLSDRYDIEIACGILYYMETSETIKIPVMRHEIRHMIMQRNELACYVRQRDAQLPPMLKKESLCNRCYAQVPCFIYHKLADDGTAETSGLKENFDEVVKHLTPTHKEFFLKWDNLLTKEEKESLKFRRELWTMLSSEREKLGRCFSNVIIEADSAFEEQNNPKINRFRYTLVKENPAPGFSFVDSQITLGEPIVISDEKGHFALANGYVTHVRKRQITVAVDRRLHNARIRQPGFDEVNNQVFASIMDVAPTSNKNPERLTDKVPKPVLYRLDKDEFSNGMATVRNNIIQVMADGPFGPREIRSLVVDLKAPEFKPHSSAYTLRDRENINVDQRRAIEKVMSAQDYALVLGMPGTGKTTTIAHIIRALVSQGKSVMLTSYTHSAVDNILLKLKHDKIPILRLGTIAKVNSDVQKFATMAATPMASFEEIRNAWHGSPVVATTCLGINHPIFTERVFDYCIVDEASQITLPVCLGPIRLARTFVLVGDHNQLPPLVQNDEARAGGLDISLFKHLSDVHPSSVVNLEHQYRMCADVMSLSNKLIYNNRLKCGTPEVANRTITIPDINALEIHHYTPTNLPSTAKTICPRAARHQCWLRDLIDPQTKVGFINTDSLLPLAREEAKGNRIINPTEVAICTQIVEALLTTGVPASTIGVITHYRSQLSLLEHSLRRHPEVEMHTADRFQGRDKEVVILSLVRSNEAKSIGELLKDWRRINVAFTRAKTKLLVVGSKETLKGNNASRAAGGNEEMVAKFVGFMDEKGWVYNLPKGALDKHIFYEENGATQATNGSALVGSTQWKAVTEPAVRKEEEEKPSPKKKKKALGEMSQGAANIINNGLKQARGIVNAVPAKERQRAQPKRVMAGEKVVLGNNPIMKDVMRDLVGN